MGAPTTTETDKPTQADPEMANRSFFRNRLSDLIAPGGSRFDSLEPILHQYSSISLGPCQRLLAILHPKYDPVLCKFVDDTVRKVEKIEDPLKKFQAITAHVAATLRATNWIQRPMQAAQAAILYKRKGTTLGTWIELGTGDCVQGSAAIQLIAQKVKLNSVLKIGKVAQSGIQESFSHAWVEFIHEGILHIADITRPRTLLNASKVNSVRVAWDEKDKSSWYYEPFISSAIRGHRRIAPIDKSSVLSAFRPTPVPSLSTLIRGLKAARAAPGVQPGFG